MIIDSPHLLTGVVKEHAAKTVKKGIEIFINFKEKISVVHSQSNEISLKIPSQTRNKYYNVKLETEHGWIDHYCNCPAYEDCFECKHVVAACLYLLHEQYQLNEEETIELLETDNETDEFFLILEAEKRREQNSLRVVNADDKPLPALSSKINQWKEFTCKGALSLYSIQQYCYYWPVSADHQKIKLTGFDQAIRHWTFAFQQTKSEIYHPEIKYDAQHTYHYRCDCQNKTKYRMCRHVLVAFARLLDGGEKFFLQYRDWTIEKNKLLQPYGLSLQDDEAKFFQFNLDYYNELKLTVPAGFYKSGDIDGLKKLSAKLRVKNNSNELISRPVAAYGTVIDFEPGYVFNMKSKRIRLGFEFELVKIYNKNGKRDIKKLSLNNAVNLPLLKQLSDEQYRLTIQLTDEKLFDYLKSRGYSGVSSYQSSFNYLSDTVLQDLENHYINTVKHLWPYLVTQGNIFLLKEGNFSSQNCKPVDLSNSEVSLSFEVTANEKFITIRLIPVFDNMPAIHPDDNVLSYYNFLFSRNNNLHIIKSTEDRPVLEQFSNGFIKLPADQKLQVIKSIIVPLQERYPVQLPPDFEATVLEADMHPQVLLKEFNQQFLMLQPQFTYNDILVDYTSTPEDILSETMNGSLQIIKRDKVKEKQFFETLRPLHESFNRQHQNDFFYVHFNEVMKGNWFLNAIRYLQENEFMVKGMESLKRFRYNTNKPKWEMKAGSGIDWFDLTIKVSFGGEEVPFKDIRKAIMNNQNIVVLGDGSFAVLPEEWLKQYALLFKMSSDEKNGSVKLNKLHFTLLDELHDQIDNVAVLEEIKLKKEKLKEIENIRLVKHSKKIEATLRPYQLSGFQWMQTLDELGWGGCLADDMGLGKTLQAITFLQFLREKYKGSTHLIVCPVSLIYNWETELNKFAPNLKYHIYYGTAREFTDAHFEDYDIILTSYGLVRNDMDQMLKCSWHYIILDESQAIKNPEAKVTKAVQLLKAKNRIILSGTPVQNNTFDLYAQFNFLNPGILGNKEFYRSEFANPIDKNNDAVKSGMLRRLIYPFLLRRTKEQVAKDLPDKTETILWCNMSRAQRSVYDDYKNYYRSMLAKKIAEEGMAKAGMYVLEGLLRLRQACDSPRLLKDAQVADTPSVKIEELLREVEENTGSHKLLVFSQFTEMLQLIKKELDIKKITYSYLDGKTRATDRKLAVDNFQNDASVKIFLISLKAGGVGLNLTAADYVYLVDPWWNPAVEQQAIDRTHRIGQSKKIFSYKMICKDTVEEKIMLLQQRKKQLANELVTEDAGFIKKLTKEDVEFLFT